MIILLNLIIENDKSKHVILIDSYLRCTSIILNKSGVTSVESVRLNYFSLYILNTHILKALLSSASIFLQVRGLQYSITNYTNNVTVMASIHNTCRVRTFQSMTLLLLFIYNLLRKFCAVLYLMEVIE